MKQKLFSLSILMITFLNASSQASLKKYPIPPADLFMIFHERAIIFNDNFYTDQRFAHSLIADNMLTSAQLSTALSFAQISQYPDGLNSYHKLATNRDKMDKYKAYWIGSWTEFFPKENYFRRLHLIWVPQDENTGVEQSMQPKTEKGFYIISKNGPDKPPVIPAHPTWTNRILKKLTEKNLVAAKPVDDLYNKVFPDYGKAMGEFYSVLSADFTHEEMDAISRNAAEYSWPDSIGNTGKSYLHLPRINDNLYYKVGEIKSARGIITLYWVSPSQKFKKGYEPKSQMGYFFCASTDESQKAAYKRDEEDILYLNSVWWLQNVRNTAYDANTFYIPKRQTNSGVTNNQSTPAGNNSGFTVTTVNGITVAKGNLTRRNKRNGVFFIYWGTGGKVKHCTAFFSEFDAKEEEVSVIKSYMSNYSDGTPFMSYSFMEGENCQSTRVRNTIKAVGCNGCSGY